MSRILDQELGAPRPDGLQPRLPSLFERGPLDMQLGEQDETGPSLAPTRSTPAPAPATGDPARSEQRSDRDPQQPTQPPGSPHGDWAHQDPPAPRRTPRVGPPEPADPDAARGSLPTPMATSQVEPPRSSATPPAAPASPPVEVARPPTIQPAPERRSSPSRPSERTPAGARDAKPPRPAPLPPQPAAPAPAGTGTGAYGATTSPVVRITIGRVEVRAMGAPKPTVASGRPATPKRAPRLSLADYLETRRPGPGR